MNLRIFSGEAPAAATDFKRKWEVMARLVSLSQFSVVICCGSHL